MVFGNLSTGYWLGAAAAAGLHWIELGRKTLTGAVETIAAGYDSKNLTVTGTDTFTTSGGSAWANWVHGQPVTAGTIIEFTVDDTSTNVFVGFGTGTGTDSLAAGAPVKNCVYLTAGGDIFWSDSTGTDNDTGSNRASGDTYKLDWESGGDIKLYVKASGGSYGSALKTWSSVSGTLYPMIQGYSGIVVTTTSNSTANLFTLPTKPYMMVLAHTISTGSSNWIQPGYRFNGDTGTNYAERTSRDGATDTTQVNRTSSVMGVTAHDETEFSEFSFFNSANQEKITQGHSVMQDTAGAGTVPRRRENVGKWANTSDQVTQVGVYNGNTGANFATGSEVVVLGYDPDDTEGTSVWEELASVDLSGGAAANLSSGTFTAKKYLMFELVITQTGTQTWGLQFNSDTGFQGTQSTYAMRYSGNGSEGTGTSTWKAIGNYSGFGDPMYVRGFIINKQDKEKLIIAESNEGSSAGSGNAPGRAEWVGKWANTSAQITSINIQKESSSHGDFATNTSMKVWGFD